MIHRVIIPDLGATGADVTIVEWFVAEGQFVQSGTPLVAVETDKATDEICAFRDGFVRQILAPAGTEIAIGSEIAILSDTADEALEAQPSATKSAAPQGNPTPARARNSAAAPGASAARPGARAAASPRAKRLAVELGIDLADVSTSRPDGIIQVDDVQRYASARSTDDAAATGAGTELSPMRRAIAEQTSRSKSEIPHFYASVDVDMTLVVRCREELKRRAQGQVPTVTDFILRATACGVEATPELNARYNGDTADRFDELDIGLVIGNTDGILIPVVREADKLDLDQIAEATADLRKRAAEGVLKASETRGGVIAISNLGMHGVDSFIAIIQPGHSAVLACGRIVERPVAVSGSVVVRPMMTACLSIDHRLCDGIGAARFLGRFRDVLQVPEEFNKHVF